MTQKKVKKGKKPKKPTKKKKIKSGMRSRSIQESLPRPKPRQNQVLKKITRQLSSDNVNFKKYINGIPWRIYENQWSTMDGTGWGPTPVSWGHFT